MDFVNIDIRKMTREDLPAVMEIENLSFVAKWNEQNMIDEMENNTFSNCWVIELSAENVKEKPIVGFVIFWITFSTATINQIAIHPDIRRRQLGTALIDEVVNECHAKKVQTLTLEVRKSNQIAHEFYLKQGFHDVCVKEKYYSNGEDALYMVMEIK